MDKFTPEYIQNVQQIIKNDEKDKARELLKDLHIDVPESFDKQEWKNKQDTPCRQMYKDGIPFFT